MPRPQNHDRLTRVVRSDAVAELALCQHSLRAQDAPRLRAELVGLYRPGHPPGIVLSLRGLTVLAAPCIATLAEVAESLSRVGGTLVLCDAPGPVARVLRRTGLSRTIRLARSPEHARRLASPAGVPSPRPTPSRAA